jgi:ubiquinone/menaquinone biosynthesis C-methylase UbiE
MTADAAGARRAARFWDRIAERYARRPVGDEAAYRAKLAMTQEVLGPESEVLELGCGTGTTAIAHAPHVRRMLATDVSPRMLEIARDRAQAAGVRNVEFRCAAVEDLEAPEADFDAVLALNLLHLLEDRDGAIARARGWLKPGGVFVTSTMCLADGMGWIRWVVPAAGALGLFPRLKTFGEAELTESLRRGGFAIERRWKPGPRAAVFLIARRAE